MLVEFRINTKMDIDIHLESVLDESELVCVAVLPVPVEVVEEWVAVVTLPLPPQKCEL